MSIQDRLSRRDARPAVTYRGSAPSWVSAAGVFTGCVVVLALLLVMSRGSGAPAGVALVLSAGTVLLVWQGVERTATGLVVLAMMLAPLNAIRPIGGAGVVTASDVFFAAGFGLLAPVIVVRRLRVPTTFLLGHGIILTVGLLVSVASTDPALSLNFMARLVAAALGLPILFVLWGPSRRVVVALAWAYVVGVVVSLVGGLAQGPDLSGRYDGLTSHVNFFGLSALLGATLIPFIASMTVPSWRWIPYAAGTLCLAGIWVSGSRAALVVVALMAVMYPVLNRSLKAAGFLALGAIVVLAQSGRLLQEEGGSALARLLGGGAAEASDLERERAIAEGVRSFYDHPVFGGGFEQALAAHNIYLQMTVAVGLVGVIGYVLILGSAVAPLVTQGRPYGLLAYPALAYVFVGLLSNILWDRILWSVLSLAFLAAGLRATAGRASVRAADPVVGGHD